MGHAGCSSCGTWAQPLHDIWDPPRPGVEPVSPPLQGRVLTTGPPGKRWEAPAIFAFKDFS